MIRSGYAMRDGEQVTDGGPLQIQANMYLGCKDHSTQLLFLPKGLFMLVY
jgi:hypothetical protein